MHKRLGECSPINRSVTMAVLVLVLMLMDMWRCSGLRSRRSQRSMASVGVLRPTTTCVRYWSNCTHFKSCWYYFCGWVSCFESHHTCSHNNESYNINVLMESTTHLIKTSLLFSTFLLVIDEYQNKYISHHLLKWLIVWIVKVKPPR